MQDWAGGWCSPCCSEIAYCVISSRYAADESGYVHCIDSDGNLKWRFYCGTLGGEYGADIYVARHLAFDRRNGDVVVEVLTAANETTAGPTYLVVKLAFADGAVKWSTSLGPATWSDTGPTSGDPAVSIAVAWGLRYGNLRVAADGTIYHAGLVGESTWLNQLDSAGAVTMAYHGGLDGLAFPAKVPVTDFDIDRQGHIWFAPHPTLENEHPWRDLHLNRMSPAGVMEWLGTTPIFENPTATVPFPVKAPETWSVGCDWNQNIVFAGGAQRNWSGSAAPGTADAAPSFLYAVRYETGEPVAVNLLGRSSQGDNLPGSYSSGGPADTINHNRGTWAGKGVVGNVSSQGSNFHLRAWRAVVIQSVAPIGPVIAGEQPTLLRDAAPSGLSSGGAFACASNNPTGIGAGETNCLMTFWGPSLEACYNDTLLAAGSSFAIASYREGA